MKKRVAVSTMAAVGILAFAGSGSAYAADTVVCGFEASLAYEHGAELSGRQSSFETKRGSANCVGSTGGRTVVGTGSVAVDGSTISRWPLTGTQGCALSRGEGSIALTVRRFMPIFESDPTDLLEGDFTFARAAARTWEGSGSVSGSGEPSGLTIAGVEEATDGDCVTRAIRSSTLRGRLLIGGDAGAPGGGDPVPCSHHVAGTRRADRLAGTADSDLISGFGADDRLKGSASADCLFGGLGDDRLSGGPGQDTVDCGPGKDVVRADASDTVAANCEAVRSR